MPPSAPADGACRGGLAAALAALALLLGAGCDTAELTLDLPRGDAALSPDAGSCRTDRDCQDAARCDAVDGACVECLTTQDCDEDELCVQGSCVECRSDTDCSGDRWRCVVGRCAECASDTDCEAGACDPSELTCEGP